MPDLHAEILDCTHALIMVLDARGGVAFFNRMCERVSGYTLAELNGGGGWEKLLLAEEVERVRAAQERLRQGHPESTHESHWITKSGERRLIEWTNSALKDDRGRLAYIIGTGTDVTERKRAEVRRVLRDSALRASLLKEVHHRVKNNLHGVITLIQQLASRQPEATAVLEVLVARLNAIALVYGLQGATGERDLPLEQILMGFVSSFKALYDDPPVRMSLGGSAVATRVMESEVVPLALIIGELVTNAIKHSPTNDGSPVEIALHSAADRASIVICNRTGRLGRHFDFDADAGLGVGLSLVRSMMPPEGVRLKLENMAGDGVRAELVLSPPAIATSARFD